MDNYDKDTVRVGICAALILIAVGICGWAFKHDLKMNNTKEKEKIENVQEKCVENCNCCVV